MAALALLVPQASRAADDLTGAARELARKTSAWSQGPVAVSYRNVSSLPDSELTAVRREFDSTLPAAGLGGTAAEARITLSENPTQFVLVEEARHGEESQVWMAAWNRSEPPAVPVQGMALNKRLVWEQEERILDVAFSAGQILVLSRSGLTISGEPGAAGRQQIPIAPGKPWPRDPRGRLRVNGDGVEAYLPGLMCTGSMQPAPRLDCRESEEPWVLESGMQAILLATYAPDRNYFDGRVVAQNGSRQKVASFYSAAAAEEGNATEWLLALVDGRTQVLNAALEPLAAFGAWGSDLVGIDARCGGGSLVLATRPGDSSEPDAIQAFRMVNRAPAAATPPVTFGGPVEALWPSSAASAVAVARDPATGKYEAYVLTLVCGP